MENWKKAVVIGSIGAGVLAFVSGRRPAGVALASVGLAVLASEYPEKFEEIWEHAPEYLTRGTQIWATLSQIAERVGEQATRRGSGAWREITSDYAR